MHSSAPHCKKKGKENLVLKYYVTPHLIIIKMYPRHTAQYQTEYIIQLLEMIYAFHSHFVGTDY